MMSLELEGHHRLSAYKSPLMAATTAAITFSPAATTGAHAGCVATRRTVYTNANTNTNMNTIGTTIGTVPTALLPMFQSPFAGVDKEG